MLRTEEGLRHEEMFLQSLTLSSFPEPCVVRIRISQSQFFLSIAGKKLHLKVPKYQLNQI